MSEDRESRRLASAAKEIVRQAYEDGWLDERVLARELDWPERAVLWWLDDSESTDCVVTLVAVLLAVGAGSPMRDARPYQSPGGGPGLTQRVSSNHPEADSRPDAPAADPDDLRRDLASVESRRLLQHLLGTIAALVDNEVVSRADVVSDIEHYLGALLRSEPS